MFTQRGKRSVPALPRRHCSLLYAEPRRQQSLIQPAFDLYPLSFFLPLLLHFFVPHYNLGDGGQIRLTTLDLVASTHEAITRRSVPLFAAISRRASECLFTDRRRDWHRWRSGCEPESGEHVPLCFIVHHQHRLYNIKKLLLAKRANCHFHWDDKKISINHKGGDNDFREE